MKNISNFSLINKEINILVSSKYLSSVRHIVNIAPQEAQWFNTLEVLDSPNAIYLKLSDHLYIPEQICSSTEVDTDSNMMINFYKDLLKTNTPEETNSIMSSLNCWSHSHHNMGVSPSSQDIKQFNFFVKSSLEQNQSVWNVMLIFNKKNEFYSRVYDPTTGNIYEGVKIIQMHEHDFSYIDEAAKLKFKKKPILNNFLSKKNNSLYYQNNFFNKNKNTYTDSSLNISVCKEIINDLFPNKKFTSKVKTSKKKIPEIIEGLSAHLDDSEILWLSLIVSNKEHLIKKVFTEDEVESFLYSSKLDVESLLTSYFSTSVDTLEKFENHLQKVLELADKQIYSEFLQLSNNI